MMYKTFITRSLELTAMLALLSACTSGGGPVTTQQREVGSFHAVEVRGAANLVVDVGPAPSLSATSDATTLGALRSKIEDGRLVVEHDRHWSWFRGGPGLEVHLTTPSLDSLVMNGAGSVTINSVAGTALELLLDGAGNMRASGNIDRLTAHLNGAGNMDLSGLAAGEADVSVNGAGKLEVRATGSLTAVVNGVGNISYAGHPHPVKTQINGVGSIKPASQAD